MYDQRRQAPHMNPIKPPKKWIRACNKAMDPKTGFDDDGNLV